MRPPAPRPDRRAPGSRPREPVAPIINGTPHDYYRPRPPQTERARQAAARGADPVAAPRPRGRTLEVVLGLAVGAAILGVAAGVVGAPVAAAVVAGAVGAVVARRRRR